MGTLQLNELEQQMADDLRWASRSPEVRQHAGKLVAVYKKQILSVGTDRNVLVAQAAEKADCGWQQIVVYVVPGAALSEIPH